MKTGVIALFGPADRQVRQVEAGQSVFLDGDGNPGSPPAEASMQDVDSGRPAAADTVPAPVFPLAGRVMLAPRRWGGPGQGHDRPTSRRTSYKDWADRLAGGEFETIIEQAKRTGIDACLTVETEQNRAAMADAARYTRRGDLARRSLLSLRSRFPSGDRARDAAFFLARQSETTGQGAREALSWYDLYLNEAGGSYAEEALGREMILLRRSEQKARVHHVARLYLKAYPRGIYATMASRLLQDPRTP
ncbi:MAG TPA: hypothetical protein VHG72_22320 [Polyangia bacterium]|nr:hypothetical protein [Polyangia bacterium]